MSEELREDVHRYREANGVQFIAMLRTVAINSLRLNGIWSVTEGIAALAHDSRVCCGCRAGRNLRRRSVKMTSNRSRVGTGSIKCCSFVACSQAHFLGKPKLVLWVISNSPHFAKHIASAFANKISQSHKPC